MYSGCPLFQTAGIIGNFAVNIMSLLYFIQVFVHDSSSVAFWLVSLISSSGFALAMDKVSWVILQFSPKPLLKN